MQPLVRKLNLRRIGIVVAVCAIVAAIVYGVFVYVLNSSVAGFSEWFKPGCGWVTDKSSFAEYADVAIPATASDLHFSGCSYGQSLVVAARFQLPPDSPDLDQFITEIGFDDSLVPQYKHHPNFSYVYDGASWWHPFRTQDYVGGHITRSGRFYDILVESQPDAKVVYVMVELD
jgi:hypothetical protein